MIPLKVDTKATRFPSVALTLIALCVGVYFTPDNLSAVAAGFVPVDFIYALLHPGRHTLTTATALFLSFFQHAGLLHLVSNMWYLWIFGSALEYAIGSLRLLALYLACGAVSMVAQAISSPLSTVPVLGASGAIAGVMGAFLLFLPLAKIVVWVPPFFFPRVFAFLFLLLWFVLQYVSMRNAAPGAGGVAWWAHIGGFCAGFLAAVEFKRRAWVTPSRARR